MNSNVTAAVESTRKTDKFFLFTEGKVKLVNRASHPAQIGTPMAHVEKMQNNTETLGEIRGAVDRVGR
jgi:hypothetical protein